MQVRVRYTAMRIVAVLALLVAGLTLTTVGQRGTVPASHAETSQTARIKAIFVQVPMAPVGGIVFPPQTFVSFQTETPAGDVVMTQKGDSPVNLDAEKMYLLETPKRRYQVDHLRTAMRNAGWTELGVDGEWYEYAFER